MADTYTISAAARLCHCDRRTLQRAIHAGRLHLDPQHGLSREELIATGYLLPDTPQAAPQPGPQDLPYDPRKFILGRLCPRQHEYNNTGKSLLRLPSRNYPTCSNANKREQRAQRQQREGENTA